MVVAKESLRVNRKRVLREPGLLVLSRRLRARRKKEWAAWKPASRSDLAIGHNKNLGWARGVLGILGECDRLLHAGDRGEISHIAAGPKMRWQRWNVRQT